MKPDFLIPFSIGHCANDLAPLGMYVIIPAFGLAMGLSSTQIGLLFMIHSMGAALAYFPAGMLADHVANQGFLLAATFFWVSFGYLAASFSEGFWAFALLIAIAGMGDAAWHPIATGATFAAWMSSNLILSLTALGIALTVLVAIRAVLLASAVDHAGGREGTSLGLTFAFMDGFAASAAVLAGLVGEKDLANAFLLGSGFTLVATYLAITAPKFNRQTVAA